MQGAVFQRISRAGANKNVFKNETSYGSDRRE